MISVAGVVFVSVSYVYVCILPDYEGMIRTGRTGGFIYGTRSIYYSLDEVKVHMNETATYLIVNGYHYFGILFEL